jgi:hypothetical protein
MVPQRALLAPAHARADLTSRNLPIADTKASTKVAIAVHDWWM